VVAVVGVWFLRPPDGRRSARPESPARASLASGAQSPATIPAEALPGRRLLDQIQPAAASREVADLVHLIAPFHAWLRAQPPEQNADVSQGLALATQRRAALKQLLALDAQQALTFRLSKAERAKLTPDIAAQLEQGIDRFGRFAVEVACGKTTALTTRTVTIEGKSYHTFTSGRRAASVSQASLPVHGIAIDDRLALSDLPYRVADPEESPTAVPDEIMAWVGDSIRAFSSAEALADWAIPQIAAEAQLPSAFGERTVLFIKMDFADAVGAAATDQAIAASMAEVDRFYRDMSGGRTTFKTTILPTTLRSARLKSDYNADPARWTTQLTEATALARSYAVSAGIGAYNPDIYRYVIVLVGATNSVSFSGVAVTGGFVWLNGTVATAIIAHEIGHQLGLSHAYAWKPTAVSPVQPGSHVEYGDPFDVMGGDELQFSAPKKRALSYMTDANIQVVTTTGQHRLYRHDTSFGSSLVALRIDAGTAYDYWLEYRREVGSSLSAFADNVRNGVLIHWNKLPAFTQPGATGTYLLDMSPGSTGDMKDSALTLGQSFYDPAYKIRITPVRTGTSSQGDWIDVAVTIGDRPGNRAPVVQSVNTSATAFARNSIALTATGSDLDGDTLLYQWDLGDGKPVYTTDSQVNYAWNRSGVFPVSVRAFDAYGGESRQTVFITVQDPLDSWTQVSVPGLTEDLNAVCFGLGKFVAAGAYVSASSSDGKTWTRSATGISGLYANAITAGTQRYVAVGATYNFSTRTYFTGIAHSADGVSWTIISTSRVETLNGVAFGAGRYVAVGANGMIWSSPDGLQWSNVQLISQKTLSDVQFDGGLFVAVGEAGTVVESADGLSWRDASVANSDSTVEGTALLNGKWIAVTNVMFLDFSARLYYWSSSGGGKWTEMWGTYFDSGSKLSAAANHTVVLGLKNNSQQPKLRYTADGKEWLEKVLGPPLAGTLRGGAEGQGRIVLVGDKGQIFVTADGLPAVAQSPVSTSVLQGRAATLEVYAYATGPFTYQWKKNGATVAGATNSSLSISSATVADGGSYTVTITNARGTTTTAAAALTVTQPVSAPIIALQPAAQTVVAGSAALFSVTASANPAPAYQWYKNTTALPGATNASLAIAAASGRDVGNYSVAVSNSLGSVSSTSASLMVNPGSVLSNLSVRTTLANGQSLIVGAVVAGGAKTVLVRAAGPALTQFGLTGLVDPSLALFSTGGVLLAANDDWYAALADAFKAVGAFAFPSGSKDAALSQSVSGAFTVQAKGTGAGVVLVEAYDATGGVSPRLVNLSARNRVGVGDEILIAGVTVTGRGTKELLIRAIGPTLSVFGVAGVLPDPSLRVLNASGGVVATNDNWDGSLQALFSEVGAFPLPVGSKDAALWITVNAGTTYTLQVSGVGNTTGEALIEVYEVF